MDNTLAPAQEKALANVPAPLRSAILVSAGKYGIPPDLLAGIWRIESGGKYPYSGHNSTYGGYFGTRNFTAPVQAQADLAASILATGLQKSKGNVSQALSYYNSGKLQGGYTTVPGEVTFGTVNPAAPKGDGSPWNWNPTTGFGIPDAVGGAVSGATGAVTGAVGDAISGAVSGVEDSAGKALLYVVLTAFAAFLVVTGLTRSLGAPGPVGLATAFASRGKAGTDIPF